MFFDSHVILYKEKPEKCKIVYKKQSQNLERLRQKDVTKMFNNYKHNNLDNLLEE